jgi:sugar-specific transcriptional regulator TrmB
MFEKYLQEIGLSDKESAVYLALLSVDNDSVVDLSKKTKINRTTIYPVLESLAKKGLISEVKVDKKIRFQAEPPERLVTFVERQKILFEEKAERVKDIVPQLKSVQRESGQKPVISYYDGKEGVLSAMNEYFGDNSGGTAYFVYSKDLVDEIFTSSEVAHAKKNRINYKIESKAIYTKENGEIVKKEGEMSDRIRVDSKKYPIKCDIGIYRDHVRIHTLGNRISAIYIESKDVAESLASLFKLAFDNLKK